MKTIAASFLILIAVFCGGCSLVGLAAGASGAGLGWVIAAGLLIAVVAGMAAAALLTPPPEELPMPKDIPGTKNQTPPDPDMWK